MLTVSGTQTPPDAHIKSTPNLAELADICRALAAGDIEQELREPSLGGHIILEASAKGGVAEHIGQALAERLSRARVV